MMMSTIILTMMTTKKDDDDIDDDDDYNNDAKTDDDDDDDDEIFKKLGSSVIGHGDVEIGEYRSVIFLLSLEYQRGRRVEHPFPAYRSSLSPAAVPWPTKTREETGNEPSLIE